MRAQLGLLGVLLYLRLFSLVHAQTCEQLSKIFPTDGEYGDSFGWAVDIHGSLAVVGAKEDDTYYGNYSGSAYIFDLTTGQQLHRLLPNDIDSQDYFGSAVSIYGNYALIGAYNKGDNGSYSGSAYVFNVNTGQQVHKILPDDGATSDNFGYAVSVYENYGVVGAWRDDDNGSESGSVYVFDLTTGQQLRKLLPDGNSSSARFGCSVSLEGSLALIGACHDDGYAGSAYLFDITTGQKIHKFVSDDPEYSMEFGTSVSLSGNHALIGAPEDNDNGNFSGSAFVFDTTTGQQIAKLLPSDGIANETFGQAVSLSDNQTLIGCPKDEDNGIHIEGSVYVFDITTGQQTYKLLQGDVTSGPYIGSAVALSDSYALVGAYDDDGKASSSGSVYVYKGALSEANEAPSDLLLSNQTVMEATTTEFITVGYFLATPNPCEYHTYSLVQGVGDADNADFVISRDKLSFAPGTIDYEVKNSYTIRVAATDTAGNSYGKPLVITVTDDRTEDFDQDGLTEEEEEDTYGTSDLIADTDGDGYNDRIEVNYNTDPLDSGDTPDIPILMESHTTNMQEERRLGQSVSIDGGYAIIGAELGPSYALGSGNNYIGSAYIFDVTNGKAIHRLGSGLQTDGFGFAVSISGNYALVGAAWADDNGTNSGCVYVFNVQTGQIIHKLFPSDSTDYHWFGHAVCVDGNHALIGGQNSGTAYIFNLTTGRQLHKLLINDPERADYFGTSVSLSGNYALVGAPGKDDNGRNIGSAYLFDAVTGQQLHKLTPVDGADLDYFGASVSLSGSYAVIGSAYDDDKGYDSGSAYVFDIATGQELHKLTATDGKREDSFGCSVSISGNYAIIGADGIDVDGSNVGGAYLFDIETGQQLQKFTPQDRDRSIHFGNAVSLSNNQCVIGDYQYIRGDLPYNPFNFNTYHAGKAYFYELVFPSPYLDWVTEAGYVSQGATSADPDSDGIGNLLTYALGLSHSSGGYDDSGLYRSLVFDNGGNPEIGGASLLLPDMPPSDVSYILEESTDLINWTELARRTSTSSWSGTYSNNVTQFFPIFGIQPVHVENINPVSISPRCFTRLRVELNP